MVTAMPHPHHEEPGPSVVHVQFKMGVEQNMSEGGLVDILENMWVGLASIEVGSLPLRRGAWFESDMYTVAFCVHFRHL